MNYMEQVAEMLGVKLGEEFMIDCSYKKYVITFNGLYWLDKIKKKWIHTSDGLDDLLTGKVKIQKPILDEAEK